MIIASGLTGTIGRHLLNKAQPLNQRLQELDINSINLNDSDSYIHLAGIVGPSIVEKDLELSQKINVESVIELAQIALKRNVSRFVYVSTAHVYKSSLLPLSEESTLEPINTYAKQKLAAEQGLLNVFIKSPEKLKILRLFSILDWDVRDFTLGGAIKRLMNESNFELPAGLDHRDFLTPMQAAELILELTNLEYPHQVVNVCTGYPLTVAQAATALIGRESLSEWEHRIRNENSKNPFMVGDNTILSKVLGRKMKWSYLND